MTTFRSIVKEISDNLWEHQRKAVKFAIARLRSDSLSCLIRMPTGTGKTGVIATLTCQSCSGISLVVTPWSNLRDQMISDLNVRFWKKLKIKGAGSNAIKLLPSNASTLLASSKAKVFVATFATLSSLRRDKPDIYDDLASRLDLVIVDECHYEPAVGWGRAIKDLNTKTVLLTATPYRNDLKLFRISEPKKNTLHYTHEEAVDGNVIRGISFDTLTDSEDLGILSEEFSRKWNDLVNNNALPSLNPRAIICCDTAESIEDTVVGLRARGHNAIGVHERFSSKKEKYLMRRVPPTDKQSATIWVHQNKLTEGLDDHRFCVLALFTPLNNDRKLVQQVGRVLRIADDDRNKHSIVFASVESGTDRNWRAYMEFEKHQKLLDPSHFKDVVLKLLEMQPEVEYFSGRFLSKFDPSDLHQNPQVIVPPSALVRQKKSSFELSDYIDNCTDTLNLEDAVILGDDLNAPCRQNTEFALWVYATISNSSLLHRRSFYQVGLATHCVVVSGEYVIIADTKGNLPLEYLDEHTIPVGTTTLSKYFDSSFRPTNTSLHNTIPFESAIRGMEIRGSNLSFIAPTITDRIQICRSARGRSVDESRYVGLGNGRLRKETSGPARSTHDYKTFVDWAKSTADILRSSSTKASAYFSRYMPSCDPPVHVQPRMIALDLLCSDLLFEFGDGTSCACVNTTVNVSCGSKINTFKFVLTFLGEKKGQQYRQIGFSLTYKPEKTKFWLTKDNDSESIRVLVGIGDKKKLSLASYINDNQSVMLISLEGGNVVYQGQSFYAVDYSYAEKSLLGCIEVSSAAKACKNEKGTDAQIEKLKSGTVKRFPTRSLFKEVAEGRVELPFKTELLICDDLGSEAADFIAVNFKEKKLAYLHVKSGKGRSISASAFHDVVAQAMKNLCYSVPTAEAPQGAKDSWEISAKWNKTQIPRLYKMPKGCPTSTKLWGKIRSEILQDNDREVFVMLVTSGCIDRDNFAKAIKDPNERTHETAQLVHLLDGLNSQARQLGVELQVKDVPYLKSVAKAAKKAVKKAAKKRVKKK